VSRWRLVALDADGTLLDESKRVTDRARRALHRLHERGVRVVLFTGRRYRIALPMVEQTGLPLVVSATNGVLVKRTSDHRTLLRAPMPPDDMRPVVRHLREEGLNPIVLVDRYEDGFDFLHDEEHRDDPHWREIHDRHGSAFLRVDDVLAWPEDVLQVMAWGEADRLREVNRRFAEAFPGRFTHHVVTNVAYRGAVFEAYALEGSKGAALRRLRELWGIPREAVLAIGDDMNDLDMLREAGLAIAMGNAVEEVRRAADRVTATNEDEGVAKALERWALDEIEGTGSGGDLRKDHNI
jgi:Cof subfamily protein (haloacid dehalogenase superfamily)